MDTRPLPMTARDTQIEKAMTQILRYESYGAGSLRVLDLHAKITQRRGLGDVSCVEIVGIAVLTRRMDNDASRFILEEQSSGSPFLPGYMPGYYVTLITESEATHSDRVSKRRRR
jgi:hypothetical protein